MTKLREMNRKKIVFIYIYLLKQAAPPPIYVKVNLDRPPLPETISRKNNYLKTFLKGLKGEYLQIIYFPHHDLSSFPFCQFDGPFF